MAESKVESKTEEGSPLTSSSFDSTIDLTNEQLPLLAPVESSLREPVDNEILDQNKNPRHERKTEEDSNSRLESKSADLSPVFEVTSLLQKRSARSSESELPSSSPWWKTWWILPFLPYLEAGEGIYLGEKLLAPLLEGQNFLPHWGVQILCTVPTAGVGFLIGLGMCFGLRKYVNSQEDNHSLIYHPSTPLVVALLACTLVGPPVAIECLPFLFDKVPFLKGDSIEIYLLTVLLTGLVGGLLAAGQCYYNESQGGKFTLFFTPLKQGTTDSHVKTVTSPHTSPHTGSSLGLTSSES